MSTDYNTFLTQQRAIWEAAQLRATKTYPPNGASNVSPTLDLWQAKRSGWDGSEKFSVRVTLPASPSLQNGQSITINVETSPDQITWTDTLVATMTGAGGLGAAAQVVTFALPKPYLQYVRIKMATGSGADVSFDGTAVLDLLFA